MSAGWAWGRRLILSLAADPRIKRFVTRYGLRLGANRFVAGENLDDAVLAVRRLNSHGIRATIDYLGESVTSEDQVEAAVRMYLDVLDRVSAEGLDANVSLKPTQMGLDIGPNLCLESIGRIAERAAALGNFVRIDMEDSSHTQPTIDVFKALHARYPNVGLVIQAYLYRSEDDVRELAALGANLRICKGAYNEPPEVAFPDKADVDANFRKLVGINLMAGNFTAIATHDEDVIQDTMAFVAEHGIPSDRFEFQMLYGIRRERQLSLAASGYRVRVYVPFGREWYPYFMRRLAERPANLSFVIRNLVRA